MKKVAGLVWITFLLCLKAVAQQGTISGTLTDASTGEYLAGASVFIEGYSMGVASDIQGIFRLSAPPGNQLLRIEYVGYDPLTLEVTVVVGVHADLSVIRLHKRSLDIEGVNIVSAYAQERKTPVALSVVQASTIERELGSQEYPEVMKMVPGIYAIKEGGGTGDAQVSLRGFKQENIALLLNGIPISSVEHGLVYWSNWLGLADVTQTIQVQKGLGASKVAMNSVGGTINIITQTTQPTPGGNLAFSVTDYGNLKTTLSLHSGTLASGFSFSFTGSLLYGPGYVDATYIRGWTYFLNVAKDIGKHHKLVFTGLGSPQVHGQNTYKLSNLEYEQYGNKFNYGWGSYNGKINNQTEGFFHKPSLSLSHYWKASEQSFVASSLYLVMGQGGGKWTESYDAPSVFAYRNPSNQIDWDAIYHRNATHTDSALLATGEYVKGYSKNIQSKFLAPHYWVGLLTNWKLSLNDHWNILVGGHGRTFQSHLYEKLTDLLGGDFFIDDYAWAVDGVAGRQQIKNTGDVIKVDNFARINYFSGFAQVEYTTGPVAVFAAATASNSWYQREDPYNYVTDPVSDWVSLAGFDVKSGFNYAITDQQRVFVNAGYYSRQPYYSFVFVNYSNAIAQDIRNEKITAAEVGYGFKKNGISFDLNGYYTYWQDKSLLSNENILLIDSTMSKSMIKGLDALHMGIELEVNARPVRFLSAGGFLSAGKWNWKNDVTAQIYDDYDVLVDTMQVYADGLNVGGSPQLQAGLFAQLDITPDLFLKANWVIHSRLYADFNPMTRTDPDDRTQPYRIPDYHTLDLHTGYGFEILDNEVCFQISCFNVTGKENVISGNDGATHDRDSFRGFWSFGRTFNVSFKMVF